MCVEVTFQRCVYRESKCMCVGLGRCRLSNGKFVKSRRTEPTDSEKVDFDFKDVPSRTQIVII